MRELPEGYMSFKEQIHRMLLERMDLRRKEFLSLSDVELRRRAEDSIQSVLKELRWSVPPGIDKREFLNEILNEALGLGPLEELLADAAVSEIMINQWNQIYIERAGKLEETGLSFSSEQALLNAISRIISPIGRRVDESSPLVDARLKDGSRVNAAIRPVAIDGPCVTIRKFQKSPVTIQKLVGFGCLTKGMQEFLQIAVEERKNIVISGGTGSGKTTLLNALSGFIPHTQRVVTIEDTAELQLPQKHVIRFESRPANIQGEGAISIEALVKNALRMRPDRIIIGECRGGETLSMLQAMNTGHSGSMTTAHANTPVDMIARLETMVLMAGVELPLKAIRQQIASGVDIILQQTRFPCGSRKVTAISEVSGIDPDDGNIILQDIFEYKKHGYDENGKVKGIHQPTGFIPKFLIRLEEEGKKIDQSIFQP